MADLPIQGVVYVVFDIAILLGLLYSSGGVNVGLGVLLVIPVLIPYLCLPGHYSILLAAVTGICLISMELVLASDLQKRTHPLWLIVVF